ncbi:MAG TPA: hypothetical protein VMX76_00960 [Nevskiaceae bacterium]|nr:hypothetical protein [Nevskiaceae bacterium]
MVERKGLLETEHLTNKGWEIRRAGGTKHETYFNESTQQWLRTNPTRYGSEGTLEEELKVFRASLAGFDQGRLAKLVRKVDFEGKQAILSPNFGETLSCLDARAKELGIQLPPSFFKQMLVDAQEMVGKGVNKGLSKQFGEDEHIVCYIVDNRLRFGFLDPNENELLPPEEIKIRKNLIRAGVFSLAEAYYGYSGEEVEAAPDLELPHLGGFIPYIKNFDE